MEVLKEYLIKHCNYPAFVNELPAKSIKNIIVIPCCNEPELIDTLNSLLNCDNPIYPFEVIVVLNSSENAENVIVLQNSITKNEISDWSRKNPDFNIHILNLENIAHKTAGVGFARKTGMDEAIKRFLSSGQENGIITCLDADSTVEKNYLQEIEKQFINKNCSGCSIYFEHPINKNDISDEINKRITEYELYLRYYKLALQFTGFPYYHFTIGSSFAVSAQAYCKSGGMNKRKAGEDFYFLQKIMPYGNYSALNTTCVYPSPRPSNRVPFGTGAFISHYLENPDKTFLTYNFEAFVHLKIFFDDIIKMYKCDNENITKLNQSYHPSLKLFLDLNKFEESIKSINSNSSHILSFSKRFFQWFDAFKILKYMNFVHQHCHSKQLIVNSLYSYFKHTGQYIEMNLSELDFLYKLRFHEKNKP